MPAKFSPKKTLRKADTKSAASAPRVRDIQPVTSLTSASSLPPEAPLQMCVRGYVTNGQMCSSSLPPEPVYQIQLQHSARPSVTHRVLHHFGTYLQGLHAADDTMPSSLKQLRDQGIILQLANQDDPMRAGFVPWRLAIYACGGLDDLRNALNLLNGFLAHRLRTPESGDLPFPQNQRLALCIEEGLDLTPEFDLPTDLIQPSVDAAGRKVLTFGVFEAMPPWGSQVLGLSLEFNTASTVQGVFYGMTFPFRTAFESQGILLAKHPSEDSYIRVLPETDITVEAKRTWFLTTVLQQMLHSMPLLVQVTAAPAPDTAAAEFLAGLWKVPNLIFRAP